MIKTLSKTNLLVLNDWLRGPLSLGDDQSLLDIFDDIYGRNLTMLATQIPFSSWHYRIPDTTLTDAILDRLGHNAYRIELLGKSQRKICADTILPST